MSENEAIGGVISEFGNIDEIAPTLGISAEIQSSADSALAPGLHGTADSSGASVASGTPAAFAAPATSPVSPASPAAARVSQSHPAVTLEEAQAYSNARRQVNGRLASAVALFVTSPVIVILLLAWHNASPHAVTASTALAVGLVAQFVFIAVGVFLMIDVTRTMGPHRRIRELQFTPVQSVTVWVEAVAETHERRRVRALQLAVMCWVFAPLPLVLLALLSQEPSRGAWLLVGVAITLVMVAIGIATLVSASWARSVSQILSARGPVAAHLVNTEQADGGIIGVIASFYWPFVVIAYLLWSFIGNAWNISWLIFPIAGLLFGAIAAGTGSVSAYRKARNR